LHSLDSHPAALQVHPDPHCTKIRNASTDTICRRPLHRRNPYVRGRGWFWNLFGLFLIGLRAEIGSLWPLCHEQQKRGEHGPDFSGMESMLSPKFAVLQGATLELAQII